jgi:hypothetical protein
MRKKGMLSEPSALSDLEYGGMKSNLDNEIEIEITYLVESNGKKVKLEHYLNCRKNIR